MLREHYFDPTFEFSSKFLKKYLRGKDFFKEKICLDIPSGNGRNIFLLASHFQHVYGVDISKKYLLEIERLKPEYNLNNVTTIELDIVNDKIDLLPKVDFICISHLYREPFFTKVRSEVKPGAIIYIETPTCRGGNYLELPNKNNIEHFFNGYKVLYYKGNVCNSDNRLNKSISYTALLEKESHGNN